MEASDASRLRDLESENTKLKKLLAEAHLDKGSDAYEQGKATQDAYNKNGVMCGTDADCKAQPGAAATSSIKVSVSIGSSSSPSNSATTINTSAASTVKAGGSVNIKATGQGSDVSAAEDVALSATKDVNILASADTESNRSSTSVGVSVGIGSGGAGLSLNIAASRGKGQANSDSTTYNNSHVSAGNCYGAGNADCRSPSRFGPGYVAPPLVPVLPTDAGVKKP